MNSLIWLDDALDKIQEKMMVVVRRNQDIIPYTVDGKGYYVDVYQKNPYWWTNGFWGGIQWQLYHWTNDPLYKRVAMTAEKKLDDNLRYANALDHDNGFKWSLTSVGHYREDQDHDAKNRALLAANALASRFNIAGNYIRAWNNTQNENRSGQTIIDCLMNLPLLYWASEVEDDSRFRLIAEAHAKMAQKYMVRKDGSVKHIITFDSRNGTYLGSLGGQGYQHGSSWTRGQAWGIYGFTLSYKYTQDQEFLRTAQKIADYFIRNIPENGFIPIDFRMPNKPFYEDSSATVVAASGMIELSRQLPRKYGQIYYDCAVKLLHTLVFNRCNFDFDTDYLLEKCSAKYNDSIHEIPIIYGDYFLIEALLKLKNLETNLW